MEKLSVVIITLNAQEHLAGCLESISSIADEIIVLDSFSTDSTEEIALRFGARFSQRKPDTLVEQMRAAVKLAKYQWVFCIDQDERATGELCLAISEMKYSGFTHDGFFVNRLSYYLSDWFTRCGWYPDSVIRLFNTGKGSHCGNDPFYKVIMNDGAKVGCLPSHLLHYPYRDLTHHISKVALYSSLSAQEKIKCGKTRFVLVKMILDPVYHFIRSYFFQLGILAGMRGFICSVVTAHYVFSKYAKVWECLEQKRKNGVVQLSIQNQKFSSPEEEESEPEMFCTEEVYAEL